MSGGAKQAEAAPPDLTGWQHGTFVLMTVVTGLVDAASYLGMGHVFTANMTGNVVLLGFALARVPGLSVERSILALTAALAGGVVAGRLRLAFAKRSRRQWLTVAFFLEALLLMLAAAVAWHSGGDGTLSPGAILTLIALTAGAMGVRNGTVRALGVPDITTTVLTLTIAAISSESSAAGGSNPRFVRRLAAVAAMLTGAYVGALLLRYGLACVLVAAALLNLAVAIIHCVCSKEAMPAQPA